MKITKITTDLVSIPMKPDTVHSPEYQDSGHQFFPSCAAALAYLYKFKDRDQDGLVEAAAALDDVDLGSGIDRSDANAVEKSVSTGRGNSSPRFPNTFTGCLQRKE